MSTKWSLSHGGDHHLDFELFEPGRVFLTLERVEFEARPGSVTVAIPLDFGERFRKVEVDDSVCWKDDEVKYPGPAGEES